MSYRHLRRVINPTFNKRKNLYTQEVKEKQKFDLIIRLLEFYLDDIVVQVKNQNVEININDTCLVDISVFGSWQLASGKTCEQGLESIYKRRYLVQIPH